MSIGYFFCIIVLFCISNFSPSSRSLWFLPSCIIFAVARTDRNISRLAVHFNYETWSSCQMEIDRLICINTGQKVYHSYRVNVLVIIYIFNDYLFRFISLSVACRTAQEMTRNEPRCLFKLHLQYSKLTFSWQSFRFLRDCWLVAKRKSFGLLFTCVCVVVFFYHNSPIAPGCKCRESFILSHRGSKTD